MRRFLAPAILLLGALLAAPREADAQAGYVQYCAVTATAPVYNPGTNQPCSIDASGNLRVTSTGGGGGGGTVTQGPPGASPWLTTDTADGPVTGGAVAGKSTLAGGQFNSAPISLSNSQQAALQIDINGFLKVNIAAGNSAGGTSSTFGAAFPATGTAAGMSQGGNLTALSGSGGNLLVALGAALPAGSAVIGNVGVAQASTTSGQSGPLVQGAVTTASPSYTTGQTSPLSLDLSGNLRVNVVAGGGAGGTSSTFGAAFPGTGTAAGMSQGGNMVALTGTAGNLNINCQVGCTAGTAASNTDTIAVVGTGLTQAQSYGLIYNGTTWDRQRGTAGSANVTVSAALPAGTNSIGFVGGLTSSTVITPTITAGAYGSAGLCVGGLQTVTNTASSRGGSPDTALLQSISVGDASGQDVNLDVVIFNANPSGSTLTDHGACNIVAADLPKIVGVVHISDWSAFSATGQGQSQTLAMPIVLSAATSSFAVAITRGTPTYAGTSNLTFRYTFLQD